MGPNLGSSVDFSLARLLNPRIGIDNMAIEIQGVDTDHKL